MEPGVVAVEVAGDGRGRLTVTWELTSDGPVEIAVGPTPESIDHERPVLVSEGRTATLEGLSHERHYVSVAPAGGGSGVVAAERLVPLEGAVNFRDLGGYPARGGRTRWGRVFRSDALHALTVEDLALVGRLGLRVVYDLRQDVEREHAPTAITDEGVRSVLLAMGERADSKALIDRILDGELDGIDDAFMAEAYLGMLERDAATFGRLLTGLTDPDGLPALFHCTAGKDRTGLTAALLLSVLGVDEEAILDDYELTNRYWTQHRTNTLGPTFAEKGIEIERFQALFTAPRPTMAGMLSSLHERWGTVDRFLVESAGMEPEALEELRRLLVQPA